MICPTYMTADADEAVTPYRTMPIAWRQEYIGFATK